MSFGVFAAQSSEADEHSPILGIFRNPITPPPFRIPGRVVVIKFDDKSGGARNRALACGSLADVNGRWLLPDASFCGLSRDTREDNQCQQDRK